MFRSLLRAGALAAFLGLWLTTPRPVCAQTFAIQPLGTIVNEAGGLNSQNPLMVAGSADLALGNYHAVRWTNVALLDLGTLGGLISEGYAINESGAVVGLAQTALGDYHAYIWQSTATGMVDIDGRAGHYSEAWAINPTGAVVGLAETTAITNPRTFHAFVWGPTSGPMIDLLTLGGQDSVAYGINAAGQIAGASQNLAQREHGTLWTRNAAGQYVLTDLGTLPSGDWSYAFAINDSTRMVGVAQSNRGNNSFHAVRWDPSGGGFAIADLGTLGAGRNSEALAVNSSGVIVGWSSTDALDTLSLRRAFIFRNNTLLDLNTLLSPIVTGWVLLRADGINNQGQIVGEGLQNGVPRLFVLTPL
jgi:probable HAF family extracellular repeat protein